MSIVTKNIGLIQAIHVGATPPSNTYMIWVDTNFSPRVHKVYNNTTLQWEDLKSNSSSRPPVRAVFDNGGSALPVTTATTIDGVTITDGDRVLVINSSNATEINKIWVATVVATSITWAVEQDGTGQDLPRDGDNVWILEGSAYGDKWAVFDGTNWLINSFHNQNTDTGTTQTSFDIDSGGTGVKLKNVAGELQIRNLADSQYGNLRVGDLYVEGTQTIINSTVVDIADNIITLNSNVVGAPLLDSGIKVERGSSTDASLIWNETTDKWTAGLVGAEKPILFADQVNDLSANTSIDWGNMKLSLSNSSFRLENVNGPETKYVGVDNNNVFMTINDSVNNATINGDVASGFVITDDILDIGLRYGGDYSSVGSLDPRWIPDVGYIDANYAPISANAWEKADIYNIRSNSKIKGAGQITLSNGSAAILGVGTDFNTGGYTTLGYWLTMRVVDSSGAFYEIDVSSVTSDTSATIGRSYNLANVEAGFSTGTSGGSTTWQGVSGTYDYYLVWNVTDFIRNPTDGFSVSGGYGSYAGAYSTAFNKAYATNNSFAVGKKAIATQQGATALGDSVRAYGQYGLATNYRALAEGSNSFAGGRGFGEYGSSGATSKWVRALGQASFNFSENNGSQVDGYGALSDNSAILGGVNHHIPSDSPRVVILGGTAIIADAALADNVYVPALTSVNQGSVTTPSVRLSNQTGFYTPSAQQIGVSIAGTERWRWSTSVFASQAGNGSPRLSAEGGTDVNFGFGGDGSTGLKWISAGNFGAYTSNALVAQFGNATLNIPFGVKLAFGDLDTYIEESADDNLTFRTLGALAMTLNNSQNLLPANNVVFNTTKGLVWGATSDISIFGDTTTDVLTFTHNSTQVLDLSETPRFYTTLRGIDPTQGDHLATKSYVDRVSSQDAKDSVIAATTASITLSGTQTIDGVSVQVGDRVLVKNQGTASDNGIYVVSAGAWTRADDFDTNILVTNGAFTWVSQGTLNGSSQWTLITNDPITLGVDALTFVKTAEAGFIGAQNGLNKNGQFIELGGTLLQATEINLDTFNLSLNGTGDFDVKGVKIISSTGVVHINDLLKIGNLGPNLSVGTNNNNLKIQNSVPNALGSLETNTVILYGSSVLNGVTLQKGTMTAPRTATFPDISGTVMYNVVEDTTPQLGGNLDIQAFKIFGNSGTGGMTMSATGVTTFSHATTPSWIIDMDGLGGDPVIGLSGGSRLRFSANGRIGFRGTGSTMTFGVDEQNRNLRFESLPTTIAYAYNLGLYAGTPFTATSGTQDFLLFDSVTLNQSVTAGFNLIRANVNENTVGSGERNVLNFSVGGSNVLKLNTAGKFFISLPTTDNTVDFIMVRDSSTGELKLRDASSIADDVGDNYWKTASGGTLTGPNVIDLSGNTLSFVNDVNAESEIVLDNPNAGVTASYRINFLNDTNRGGFIRQNSGLNGTIGGTNSFNINTKDGAVNMILGANNIAQMVFIAGSDNIRVNSPTLFGSSGTATAGVRLDVRGTTTATTQVGFRYADLGNSDRFTVNDQGQAVITSSTGGRGLNILANGIAGGIYIRAVSNSLHELYFNQSGIIKYNHSSGTSVGILITDSSTRTSSTGLPTELQLQSTVSTSGTAEYTNLLINPIYSVTSSSATIGIKYNPSGTISGTHYAAVFGSGRVGIGTLTPSYDLDVSSSIVQFGADNGLNTRTSSVAKVAKLLMPSYAVSTNPYLLFNGGVTATDNYFQIGGGSVTGYASTYISFHTAANNTTLTGTERMRITSTGIGIGVTDPTVPLEIRTDGVAFRLSDAGLAHGMTSVVPTNVFGSFEEYADNNGGLIIRALNSTTSGATSPLFFVGIHGAASPSIASITFRAGKKSATSYGALAGSEEAVAFDNYTTRLMTLLGSGRVGIGTLTPDEPLHVNVTPSPTIIAFKTSWSTGILGLTITGGGDIVGAGGLTKLNASTLEMRVNNGDATIIQRGDGATADLALLAGGNAGTGTYADIVFRSASTGTPRNLVAFRGTGVVEFDIAPPAGASGDDVLVWDSVTKEIKKVTQASLSTSSDAWLLASGGTLTGNNTITGTGFITDFVWNSLATSPSAGLRLANTTDAAFNAQQYSPYLIFRGSGWSIGGNSSQFTDFRFYVLPAQNTGTPTASLKLGYATNGGAFTDILSIGSGGSFENSIISTGATIAVSSAGSFQWTSRSVMRSAVDGDITLLNAANNSFGSLRFGGTTSSYPSLMRSGADLILTDGAGGTASSFLIGGASITANTRLDVRGIGGGNAFRLGDSSTNATLLLAQDNGLIGVNTSPSTGATFHVKGQGGAGASRLVVTSTGGAAGIAAERTDGQWALLLAGTSGTTFMFEKDGQFSITEALTGATPYDPTYASSTLAVNVSKTNTIFYEDDGSTVLLSLKRDGTTGSRVSIVQTPTTATTEDLLAYGASGEILKLPQSTFAPASGSANYWKTASGGTLTGINTITQNGFQVEFVSTAISSVRVSGLTTGAWSNAGQFEVVQTISGGGNVNIMLSNWGTSNTLNRATLGFVTRTSGGALVPSGNIRSGYSTSDYGVIEFYTGTGTTVDFGGKFIYGGSAGSTQLLLSGNSNDTPTADTRLDVWGISGGNIVKFGNHVGTSKFRILTTGQIYMGDETSTYSTWNANVVTHVRTNTTTNLFWSYSNFSATGMGISNNMNTLSGGIASRQTGIGYFATHTATGAGHIMTHAVQGSVNTTTQTGIISFGNYTTGTLTNIHNVSHLALLRLGTFDMSGTGDPFNPASGTTNFTGLLIDPTMSAVNAGGWSGVLRGIYYNPTINDLENGTHYFIDATSGLVRVANGTEANPTYVFQGSSNSGLHYTSGIGISIAGQDSILTTATDTYFLDDGGLSLLVLERDGVSGSRIFFPQTPSAGAGADDVLVWDATTKEIKKVTQASLGGGSIGGSITDNQVAIGAATANTIEGSSAFTFDGTNMLINNSGAATLKLGASTGLSTATPTTLNMGGTYADTVVSSKAKWKLYEDGTAINTYGIGISSGQFNFFKATGGTYRFYFADVEKLQITDGAIIGIATQSVFNTVSTNISFAGAATTLTIGATTGTMTLRNPTIVGQGTTATLWNTVNTTVNFASAATTFRIGASTGTLTIGNATVVGLATTQNLYNTVATTMNFAGAATTLNIGNTTTLSQTINIGGSSTGASNYFFASGQTAAAATKLVSIGTGGLTGSTTTIALGSLNGIGSSISLRTNTIFFIGGVASATFATSKLLMRSGVDNSLEEVTASGGSSAVFLNGAGGWTTPSGSGWATAGTTSLTGNAIIDQLATGGTPYTVTFKANNLADTQTDGRGILLINETDATLSVQSQISPSLTFEGQGWEMVGEVTEEARWTVYNKVEPNTYGTVPALTFAYSRAGDPYTVGVDMRPGHMRVYGGGNTFRYLLLSSSVGVQGVHLDLAPTTTFIVSSPNGRYFDGTNETDRGGSAVTFRAGDGVHVSGAHGGHTYIDSGNSTVAGVDGNIAFFKRPDDSVNFQSMEKGIFIANTVFNPSGVPTGGGFLYVDAGDSSKIKWRVPGGTIYDLTGGGGGTSLNSLTAATGANSINNTLHAQTWSWDTLAGGTGFILSSSSTAATGNTQTLFEVNLSGANVTASQGTYAMKITNTHTGTSPINRGLSITTTTTTTGSNTALTLSASGSSFISSNIALAVNQGQTWLYYPSGHTNPRRVNIGEESTTGTLAYALRLYNGATTAPTPGNGVGIEFETYTSTVVFKIGNTIESVSTAVGVGSETFDLVIRGMNSNSLAERMRVKGSGNISFGTGSNVIEIQPSWVGGSSYNAIYLNPNTGTALSYSILQGNSGGDTGSLILNAHGSGYISFREDNNGLMYLSNAGNLGIGTELPVGRLTIQGAAGTNGIDQGIGLLYSTGVHYGAIGLNNSSGWPQIMARDGAGLTFHTNSDLLTTNERMRIDANGNVGIGTTTPDANQKLTVNGDIRLSGASSKIVVGTAGVASDYLLLQDIATGNPAFQWVQDGSAKFTIDGTTGNVSAAGSVTATNFIGPLEGMRFYEMSWGHDYAHGTWQSFDSFINTSYFGAHFVQGTTGSPGQAGVTQYYHMRLSLGSNYDNYALQLAVGRNITDAYLWYRGEENGVATGWSKIKAGDFNNGFTYSSGSSIYVDTLESINTNDWLELVYYGGLGVRIGTGVNGSKALYAGALYDAGNRVLSSTSALSWYASDWFRSTGDTGWYNSTYVTGIYATSTQLVQTYNSSSFQANGAIYATGDITASYSDKRLKENIVRIESVLERLKSISGYYYNANDLALSYGVHKNKNRRLGVIAQEINLAFPEAVALAPFDVDHNNGGSLSGEDYLTVRYDRLVPVLIQGIKELDVKYEDEVTILKRRVSELELKVKRLEA